jgi:phage terminase large subunit
MSIAALRKRLDRLEQTGSSARCVQRTFPTWLEPEIEKRGCGTASNMIPIGATDWKYDTLPAQRAFHSDLISRFKGYSGPIGSGKSHALVYEALLLTRFNPGLLGLIGAPTYRMLEDSTQRTFFDVLAMEGIDYVFHKQDNRIRFQSNASEIIFRSLDNPERLRGPNLAWFAVDELTYAREDAWTRLLGRLRHPRARRLCGVGVWTPKGYDWVHQRFVAQRNPDCRLVQASPKENTHLPQDFYDRLKDSYAELFYRQEVLGEYLDIFGGNTYYAFSENNVEPQLYDSSLALCWALDFNVDPMCSVICQIEEWKRTPWSTASYESRKILHVLDEIVLPNSNTVEAAEAFIERVNGWKGAPPNIVVKIYGDASGNSRTSKSTQTDYELVREVFRRNSRFSITLLQNKANPVVRDRVNTVNNVLCSTSGERNVLIDPKCQELIKDLRQVRWKRDSEGNPAGDLDKSDAQRTHVSDALSYLVVKEFGLRARAGERPGVMQ